MPAGDVPDIPLTITATADLSSAIRADIVALCTRAFARDFGNLFDFVTDSRHVLAHRDSVLIGHACWATRHLQPDGHGPLRTGYVDAVAVDPALHRRGIGSRIIARVNAELRGYELGGLSTPRVAFYTRLGWERWVGPTAVRGEHGPLPTPEDTVMILRTPRTPPLDPTTLLVADWRDGQPW